MKKNILTKILLGLLVVLLALSIVACKPSTPPDDDGNGNDNGNGDDNGNGTEEESNIAKMGDIQTIVNGLEPLASEFDRIEDEMHLSLVLNGGLNNSQFTLAVDANIYGDAPNHNEISIEAMDIENTEKIIGIYLKDNVFYLDQGADKFTANTRMAKFSHLDGVKISEALSDLPGYIHELEMDGEPFSLATLISDLSEEDGFFDEFRGTWDNVVAGLDVLDFEETDEEFILSLNSSSLKDFIPTVADLMGEDILDDFGGLLDFVSDILFGVPLDEIEDAETEDLPRLSITASKVGEDAIDGLQLEYTGDLDDTTPGKETISFGISAALDSADEMTIDFPDFSNFVESALKASAEIDLGLKDIYLKADVYANPDFEEDGDDYNRPTAFLTAYDVSGDPIVDLDAEYKQDPTDGKYYLYFDLAGLYEMVDPHDIYTDPSQTMYKVEFDFLSDTEEVIDDGEEAAESVELPFDLAKDWMMQAAGLVPTVLEMFETAIEEMEFSLDVATVLDLTDGLLVQAGTDDDPYTKENMIADIEGAIAPFAADYDEEDTYDDEEIAFFAQSVINEISGVDISVADLINAETGDDELLEISLGVLEEGLGLNLDLATGEDEVADVSVELDIVPLDDIDGTGTTYDDAYPGKDYSDAVDLYSELDEENPDEPYNIYYVDEGEEEVKHYVILDDLLDLLEAYRNNAYLVA